MTITSEGASTLLQGATITPDGMSPLVSGDVMFRCL